VAAGELVRFDAVLDTKVQELVAGEAVSFDQAFEDFEATSAELPLRVASNLVLPLGADTLTAAGQGFVDFFEPAIALGQNPAELGLEADTFSLDEEVSYQVTASALETRTVHFNRAELGGVDDAESEVESSIYLSGAVFVWSLEPDTDLTGLQGEVLVIVEQIRQVASADGEDPAERVEMVFSTSIGVSGGPGGVVEPLAEGNTAAPGFVFGGPEILLDAAGSDASLERYLGIMGSVRVLLVPEQELRYRYQASADEEFRLEATFSVEVTNLPGGTGVAAVFGRPFDGLADMIDAAFVDVEGEAVQSAVNRAQAKAQASAFGDVASTAQPSARLCGAIGMGMVGLLLLLGAAARLGACRGWR
jgi:hypothetical protein